MISSSVQQKISFENVIPEIEKKLEKILENNELKDIDSLRAFN